MPTQTTIHGLEEGSARRDAMERAGRLLGVRARTERELRTRLAKDGHPTDAVDAALERLKELGLVDDAGFAREWIEERTRLRGRGHRALVAELEAKGVGREVTESVLADLELDETAQAQAWAVKLFVKVADHPFEQQGPRLAQLLYRRGFSEEAVHEAVRAVMPPEGWD